jgi:hypothetical protein
MKLSLSKILIAGACFTAMAVVLLARTLLYPAAPVKDLEISQHRKMAIGGCGTITIHYHDRRPYYIEDQNGVQGLCADPIQHAFQQAGLPYIWRKTPAKRQLEAIRRNHGCECAAGWFKSAEREAYAKYTLPIYQDNPTMALARSDNDHILTGKPLAATLADPRLRLLRKDGYTYGEFIDRHIDRHQPPQLITTAGNLSMLKMIHARRADYFFISAEEAAVLVSSSGMPAQDFKQIRFSDMPEGNYRYLICSQNVEDRIMARLNQVIERQALLPPTAESGHSRVVQ